MVEATGPTAEEKEFKAMAVPKKKTSKSRRDMRRAHHALKSPTVVEDKHTGENVRPHHVCRKTGMYKGVQVIDVD